MKHPSYCTASTASYHQVLVPVHKRKIHPVYSNEEKCAVFTEAVSVQTTSGDGRVLSLGPLQEGQHVSIERSLLCND
jgi:hypothetical protein